MKQIKWIFLLFALAAVISMMFIGVAIAEKNLPGVIGAVMMFIIIMGIGFSLKKRMRNKGLLD
ncbi:YlaF family protein [Bacillus sp. CLL-7-23]|uniref:YlaF family protein n=1 Tax=Bacillus changyiensis TaxID=3004103 RepID=A0ABT4X2A0_9BACI|nr:YlaF family protein [Bacillus changyiensis]MDA7026320.1 YlaF family protein [Bacillus changyiensis]